MRLPTQRLTITRTEYRLLKPGLDVLANGLATAKLGRFPRRHPYHNIDFIASAVYRNQAYSAEMAAKIISVHGKIWELTQSRKIRLDPFELAVAAFALRLWKSHKTAGDSEASADEIKLLEAKIETYRKRSKRAAIAMAGKDSYQVSAECWKSFVAWCRYHLLYFKLPNRGQPLTATLWREQRLQITELINKVLAERFFEVPSEAAMARVVTLITCSLRRCRHSVGLRELLRSPQKHNDFLFGFVEKRVELNRLPGAPIPDWEAVSIRADRFREFQQNICAKSLTIVEVNSDKNIVAAPERRVPVAPKVKPSRRYTHDRQILTEEILLDAMGTWLHKEVTTKFNFTREVCEQAQHQIRSSLLDQYRIRTVATSFRGVVQELRPSDPVEDQTGTFIEYYAAWMLGILLALRRQPKWMYNAIETIGGRATQLEKQARNDKWTSTIASRRQCDPLSA
jgi:hypothetical protein